MDSLDYTQILRLNAAAQKTFEGINSISKWWTENIIGHSQKLGDEFTVTFGTTWKTFKIIEWMPAKKVVWQVLDCYLPWNNDQTEWTGTKISFEIREKDNQSEICFTHFGLTNKFNCFDACSNAWTSYLNGSLAALISSGKGAPDAKKG